MTKMAVTEVSTQEKCLVDMPYEIVFEIFRTLSKGKLFKIYRLPSKLGNVARDTRLWKDVCIEYWPADKPGGEIYDFEELYSEPLPVKMIHFSHIKINPPVFFKTEQVVNVKRLFLSSVTEDKETLEAIFAKYQCTELYLDFDGDAYDDWPQVLEIKIAPETFSKLTDLEVLSLRNIKPSNWIGLSLHQWLEQVLSVYCKNLKILDLSNNYVNVFDLAFVKNLPTSLEKLRIGFANPGDSFFALLAGRIPDLKELGLTSAGVKCPSLLNFKSLETLHFYPKHDLCDLYMYLIRFATLKNVHCEENVFTKLSTKTNVDTLRMMLKPHGITVTLSRDPAYVSYVDGNLWQVVRSSVTC